MESDGTGWDRMGPGWDRMEPEGLDKTGGSREGLDGAGWSRAEPEVTG